MPEQKGKYLGPWVKYDEEERVSSVTMTTIDLCSQETFELRPNGTYTRYEYDIESNPTEPVEIPTREVPISIQSLFGLAEPEVEEIFKKRKEKETIKEWERRALNRP